MKKIPASLPQGHAIYCLFHRGSRTAYIGSTTNIVGRAYEWSSVLKGNASRQRPAQFPDYPVDEWTFKVMRRTEGMSYNELRALEEDLIGKCQEQGLTLLNRLIPTPKATFTVDGLEGSATFHACRLGISPNKVINKLKRGCSIEEALSQKEFDHRQQAIDAMGTKIVHEGKYITMTEATLILGRSTQGIRNNLQTKRKRNPNLKEVPLEALRYLTNTPTPL